MGDQAYQLRAFGGGPLEGERIVKFAYLDEAGIGGEPWVVVAGVIMDPDIQWKSIRRYLDDMANYFLLPEDRTGGYAFHAKEIFSGTRRWDKSRYSLDTRREVLRELCKIPFASGMPIVAGLVDLLKYERSQSGKGKSRAQITSEAHRIAYANCVCNVDYYLKYHCDPEELVTLVVENNADARHHLKETQFHLNSDEMAEYLSDHPMSVFLPLTKIVDVPHFVEKADSPIMQIADVCAFVIMRHCCELPYVEEYVDLLRPKMFVARETGEPPADTTPDSGP